MLLLSWYLMHWLMQMNLTLFCYCVLLSVTASVCSPFFLSVLCVLVSCVGQRHPCSCVCFWFSVSSARLLISLRDFLLDVSQVNRTTIDDLQFLLLLFCVFRLQSNGKPTFMFLCLQTFHRSSLLYLIVTENISLFLLCFHGRWSPET